MHDYTTSKGLYNLCLDAPVEGWPDQTLPKVPESLFPADDARFLPQLVLLTDPDHLSNFYLRLQVSPHDQFTYVCPAWWNGHEHVEEAPIMRPRSKKYEIKQCYLA